MRRLSLAVAVGFVTIETVFALKANDSPPSAKQMYVVKCRVSTKTADSDEAAWLAPTIAVPEGETATISDVTHTPVVPGAKVEREREVARTIVLEEGLSVELSVYGDRPGFVSVDATIKTSKIVEMKNKRSRQAFRQETCVVRASECLALGEPWTIDLEGPETGRTAQFTVSLPEANRLATKTTTTKSQAPRTARAAKKRGGVKSR